MNRTQKSVRVKYHMPLPKGDYGTKYVLTVFIDEDGNEYIWCHDKNAKVLNTISDTKPMSAEFTIDETVGCFENKSIFRITRPTIL